MIPRVSVLYTCQHYREFTERNAPSPGDELFCLKCDKLVRAVSIVDEYRVRCCSGRCKYSSNFGQAKLRSEIAASKHHRKFPKHEVKLFKGSELVHTWPAQSSDLLTTEDFLGSDVNTVNMSGPYRL